MSTFEDLNISRQLQNSIDDLGLKTPTPVQEEAYPVILSGKDVVGISQTGTGKTFAYLLPLLHGLKFSKQVNPRILILVPTRELVVQVIEQIESLTKYITVRVLGIYGDTNINTQKQEVAQGADIIVATPGRLYDLAIDGALRLKAINKLVIDEVDVMLDLGFVFQLSNIFELLPERRQNIMFSATMTDEVDELIDDFFISPTKISIAVSGTPLDNISQSCYSVKNFHTKVNLLTHLLKDKEEYRKVLVFVSSKKIADRLFEGLQSHYASSTGIIHSNKTQNYRLRSVEQFDEGVNRILVATDVIARGLDLDEVSHVVNFDTPNFPENYMHRIGRTGRAEKEGKSILFYTEQEEPAKEAIEALMSYEIPQADFPDEVVVNNELIPEERPKIRDPKNKNRNTKIKISGPADHEKLDKNKKTNQGGSYKKKMALKYKKPKTRGDKNYNKRKKRK